MEKPVTRSKKLLVRWTPAEYQSISERAAGAEITPTDYIRTRALDSAGALRNSRAPSVERRLLATALSRLGDIGDVLIDIQQQAQVGERPFDHILQPALVEVRLASKAILRALGVIE